LWFEVSLEQIVQETLSQKPRHKKGLAECLKVQTLSSNPSTIKKKKKKKKKEIMLLPQR
jgi:hypothetical protein